MDAKVKRPLNQLGVTEIASAIAAGEVTCEAVVQDCLKRINARDSTVKAFVNYNPEYALVQARALDGGPRRGPLHGVPVGLKDTIDTFDMATEMGSPIFRGNRPRADAACVALLRRAGAVILGKTATCEFAGSAPPATTNPHNAAHTPGGSSSGSAAAVADYMLPAALGTQTGGSVLRPSSFCGIFGFKPTYNSFNKAGVWPAADFIDTLGWLARSIEDIELLSAVLRMEEPKPLRRLGAPPRIGVWRTDMWDTAQPESKAAVENAASKLGKAGATVRDVVMPEPLHRIARHRASDDQLLRTRRMHGLRVGSSSRPALAADAALYREWPQDLARRIRRRHAPPRSMPRAAGRRIRKLRRTVGALRAGRGAEGPRRDRRSQYAGDLDGAAYAVDDAADPPRPERFAGRHPACRATLRRRPAARRCALDLGQDRHAGVGRRRVEVHKWNSTMPSTCR